MTVEQFNPKQTTTLETPKKVLAAQAIVDKSAEDNSKPKNSKIGFVSLG